MRLAGTGLGNSYGRARTSFGRSCTAGITDNELEWEEDLLWYVIRVAEPFLHHVYRRCSYRATWLMDRRQRYSEEGRIPHVIKAYDADILR